MSEVDREEEAPRPALSGKPGPKILHGEVPANWPDPRLSQGTRYGLKLSPEAVGAVPPIPPTGFLHPVPPTELPEPKPEPRDSA
jgi:hypothetical protein